MDNQKRLYLAIGLMLSVTLGFQYFVWGPQLEAERAKLMALDGGLAAVADGGAVIAGLTAEPAQLMAAPTVLEDGGVVVPAPLAEVPVRTLEQLRPSMKMVFTSQGAGLTQAELTGPRERQTQNLSIPQGFQRLFGKSFPAGPQMDLARPVPGQGPQLAISLNGTSRVSPSLRYQVTEETPGKLVFTGQEGPWQVVKTFTWDPTAKGLAADAKRSERDPRGYQLHLAVQLTNAGAQAQEGELAVHAVRAIDPATEEAPSMFGGIGNQAEVLCKAADKVVRKKPDNDEPGKEEKGSIGFIGIDQQYFLTAVWPSEGSTEGRCTLHATTGDRSAELLVKVTVPSGGAVTRHFDAYLGPKDLESLQVVASLASPGQPAPAVGTPSTIGLDQTVDFGWWAVICKGLLFFMRFFQGVTGNWGVAVILLTVMVKVALLPLTHKAMVSAESMKKLQPEMEKMKAKYPDDKEKQNLEMMRLYQEAKVNPLGGCLPLLVQLPIWAALFTTLRTSYELYGEPFFGVWADLTSKDPTYLLPFALGITMIVTQRLQPQMMDQSQAFLITWVMPIFFTAIMMNYPAGLALYIFTNNLLSITQQFALRKYLERTGQAAPRPPPPPPGPRKKVSDAGATAKGAHRPVEEGK